MRSRGPWRLALARLRGSPGAVGFGVALVLVVTACLAAPLWADAVAGTSPSENHLSDRIEIDGEVRDVVSLESIPIGPTWNGRFFLGADPNGRDLMVRLLYGGRSSLLIAGVAALIATALGVLVGMLAGYFGGWVDTALSRMLDLVWSFPVLLLGVALGTALNIGGARIGPLEIEAGSPMVPILVSGLVFVPYMARPVRAHAMALREREFVQAARAQGAGSGRILFSELLPNLSSTILALFTLVVAHAIVLEAALSFLGAGVQPPEPSWGSLVRDGIDWVTVAPHLLLFPSLAIVVAVLCLNVLGDAVREALKP